jgi:hypothetical protein
MKKKNFGIWAITFVIAGLMITSVVSIPADENTAERNVVIKARELDNPMFTPCPYQIKSVGSQMELKDSPLANTMPGNFNPATLGTDIPVIVMAEDIDVQNPSIMDDVAGNIVIASEAWLDVFTPNIFLRYSNDGGETWIPEDTVLSWALPENDIYDSMPAIDFAGDNGGFGTMLPIDPPMLITITFEDISDHEAGEGWLINPWTTDSHMVEIDSADAGGVNSQFSPDPAARGIVIYTGDEATGEDNILYISWHEGEDALRGVWTGGGDDSYEWEKAVCDVDLSTGMYYESYLKYDDKTGDPKPDGVELEWCQLDGTGDWWQGSWYYIHIDGSDNPDVKADGGNCYLVYELDGAIECLYSNDNAGNFQTVTITNDGQFPSVTAVGETVICSYTRNGNLYTSVSENGGAAWVETQTNDVSGSVVEQLHCADVSGNFVTWTDDRDGVNGIYLDTSGIAVPVIEIGISGGMKVNAVVSNTGSADAVDLPYTMAATGGILGMINKETSGTISIPAGEDATISLPIIIGLGPVIVTATVGTASEEVMGTQLLIFTKI